MSNIQLQINPSAEDILQMQWQGKVTLSQISEAFQQLNDMLGQLSYPVNLMITVRGDAQLPSQINIDKLPRLYSRDNLRGWMLIGDNLPANRIISMLMLNLLSTTIQHPLAE